jgi:hypothetical protein
MNQNSSTNPNATGDRTGFGTIVILFGALLVFFALLGVLNTATGWELTFKNVPLPKTWDATISLFAVAGFFWVVWSIINFVKPLRRYTRNHPWVAALLIVLFLVGLIVGITIWDNGNIKAREEARQAEAVADSLDRIKDSKTFFEGKPIPYRLAVLNPESAPVEVWVDSQAVGTIPGLSGTELQLPWTPVRVSIRQGTKELAAEEIKPDASQAQDAALLHVYNPLEKLQVWLFDYESGYEGGKLVKDKDFESDYVNSYYHEKLFEITQAGPFYILPNQKAPETTQYHAYRLVLLPDAMEDPSENRPLAWWMMRRTDTQPAGSPAQSPEELYEVWKAE